MIIHKPQSNVHCTMIKITGTENDMEDGTEMLYTETNCFVKLKPKEVENVFHLKMNRRIYYAKRSSTSVFIRTTQSLFSALWLVT